MAANGVEDKKTQEVKNKVDTGAVDEIACFLTKECPREFNAFYRVLESKKFYQKNNSSIWIYGIFKLPHLRKIQTPRKELFHV